MTDAQPYGRLLSAGEAEELLGIPAATVQTWHYRRERTGLFAAGHTRHGRRLFYEADLLGLKHGLLIRDERGERVCTMADVLPNDGRV